MAKLKRVEEVEVSFILIIILKWEGKEMLIKSALSSIPLTICQSFHAPTSVTKKLEEIQRNFLREAADGARKISFGVVGTVTSPKKWGGLGMKDSKVFNKAL